ncbi:Hypothetical predicted protein [Mytilus galloprovincialis]|uniref:Uncharacterized protein n=1 Tax=Mytilus galloprovincialis TaxID=29158 RepID=A0A8B6ETU6_MYTGA|nr:Hypothetical predicted protein [Mytilus galloprovincialis]
MEVSLPVTTVTQFPGQLTPLGLIRLTGYLYWLKLTWFYFQLHTVFLVNLAGFWLYCGLVTTVVGPKIATSSPSAPTPRLTASSSSSVSLPDALSTTSIRNQVTDTGPSLYGFKRILDDFVR